MNKSSEKGPSKAELEELTLLLENRTFVDYFNTFLCLPVFGQHVFYNYMEMEFEFEPPIRNGRHLYLDRRMVVQWLCTERLRSFKRSALYTEYNLCMLLRETKVKLPGLKFEKGQDTGNFNKNTIGTAVGMMLFRESMRSTCGENVYRCWKDIEAWRLIEDPVKKMYWKHVIKTHYINENSTTDVASNLKVKVFRGILNFELVPDIDIHQQILDSVTDDTFNSFVESDAALLKLQAILLDALRKYWLPRHLLHIIKTVSKKTLNILKKPLPGDKEYVDLERRFRCRYMFPKIYQDSSISSPATTILISQSADDLAKVTPTTSLSSFDDDELKAKILPVDLLSLWGGPAKEIDIERVSPSNYSPFLSEINSPADGSGDRLLRSAKMHGKSPIPIVLTSYLGGKKRTLAGKFPKTTNRVIWYLASDTLACCPFREFLQRNERLLDLQYLGFWTDVRNYLDTDEHAVDGYGKPLRQKLARRIAEVYLSKERKKMDIFSEKLKMSLFTAISTNDDISLLCMAQDIAQTCLLESLKSFIDEERCHFLKQVRGQRNQLDRKQRRAIDKAAKISKSKFDVDPLYFFNCVTLDADSEISSPLSPFSPTMPCDSAISATSYRVSITEEQMWKAMEIAVLCSEYGVSMMLPQHLPRPSQLIDILHSDYGSLHVTRVPTVRHEWLRSLTEKPKINIETLKVSRKVLVEDIDIASLIKAVADREDSAKPKIKSRVPRRTAGLIVEKRPTKPKSLLEVMSDPVQYDFFKRFMVTQKVGLPVLFWRAVEDLQEISIGKIREIKVTQIMRKFFGRFGKYGAALDCDEEIIFQIPHMDKVNPGILMCAQAAVFRSLERKWFPQYIATFQSDSDSSNPSSVGFLQSGMKKAADFVSKTKKMKKRALGNRNTMLMWKRCSRTLADFVKGVSSKCESQLFEMFLKYEFERDKQNPQQEDTSQVPPIEKNIMMSDVHDHIHTRVVARNRLVIMKRLPSDLRFWIEVRKYQNLVDSASQKNSISVQDTEFLTDKARSIISCFLASDILPKVQVNIPHDMALNIINSLASYGPKRGMFHDAIVLLFPILYHFYRKFSEEWMKGDIPDDYFDSIEHMLQCHVSTTPHRKLDIPDFTALKPTQVKNVRSQDETMKIHFSISEGVTLIYPLVKRNKSLTTQRRRMAKCIIYEPDKETSLQKESSGEHGDKKDDKQSPKGGDKAHHKHDPGRKHLTNTKKGRKKSEKTVGEESEHVSADDSTEQKGPVDKALRLRSLIESINKEKEEKIKEQNKLFSKIMSIKEVVRAALDQSAETNSTVSNDISVN
ncbi:regulator of G-protein signaling protein-like [Mercenaria mercenaria]|uniref:regulator of G-protein signaling protein-like n=1 Tax=Mercenaria mercenaria TaxID=6596 RepID=UPI00234F36AE|nr:regulator of G-protein signaling protein-like [Mercenaria mercenaria]